MRVSAPISNYIQATTLTTIGDMLTRDAIKPIRIAGAAPGYVMQSRGAGNTPMWKALFGLLTTGGDLWVRGATDPQRLAAGVVGTYLQGKGVGVIPAYESSMPPLTTHGDLLYQGAAIPERLGGGVSGQVLRTFGPGANPVWQSLFDLITVTGDIYCRGGTNPERLVAGSLDTYLKAQGAGVKPIYEKMTLNDTGVKISNWSKNASGDLVISGLGYEPSVVFIFSRCNDSAIIAMSWGFFTSSQQACVTIREDSVSQTLHIDRPVNVYKSAAHSMYAVFSSMDGGGFTLTFTLTGTVTAMGLYCALP